MCAGASRFVGYDLSEEGIAAAQQEADALSVTNARFETRDVTDLGLSEAFDLVTAFDGMHDQARPTAVLAGIAQVLRRGGTS